MQTFRYRPSTQTATSMPNPYAYDGWSGDVTHGNSQIYGSPITPQVAPSSPWTR
ncbi:hypothetical protein [Paraburkholderia rhizosphaerae]|uniref:hypothetical protein n=1 Tax=Paraburkholderia rhizosphaerae TaxID=480658 RepID=UPI0014170ADC|nr:hypothetical protein [Paraburkholderia rhizosphaerae]